MYTMSFPHASWIHMRGAPLVAPPDGARSRVAEALLEPGRTGRGVSAGGPAGCEVEGLLPAAPQRLGADPPGDGAERGEGERCRGIGEPPGGGGNGSPPPGGRDGKNGPSCSCHLSSAPCKDRRRALAKRHTSL
mmetsp:Transcript_13017/g.46286  ORF Transcript_13017/g.46286 Transcript_13017/m.46286 type:complete len:134 (-) Transcript_13017:1279-1680(-)